MIFADLADLDKKIGVEGVAPGCYFVVSAEDKEMIEGLVKLMMAAIQADSYETFVRRYKTKKDFSEAMCSIYNLMKAVM